MNGKIITTTFSWGKMLDQLLAADLTVDAIGKAMGFTLSQRMIEHYRRGVQPLHWRGEGLIELWCKTFRKPRTEAPTVETDTYGKARGPGQAKAHAALNLPNWPAVAQRKPQSAKKRGSRSKAEMA